ncbi:MAG: twin-arginine translocase TatA/TatE family subunit [Halobacteriales archaeon]
MISTLFTPLQFGMPGGMELAVILLIAVLLFGANKIPKLARATGQAMGEFQRGREEIEQELEEIEGSRGEQSRPDETGETDGQADSATDGSSTSEADAAESTTADTAATDDATEATEDTDEETA